jgi:hypothetical protein
VVVLVLVPARVQVLVLAQVPEPVLALEPVLVPGSR